MTKMFSVLLAWAEDDDEQGTFGWSGLAADADDAEAKARKASVPSHNGYEDSPAACVDCGCTDNDGSDICPDCGGAIEDPDESEFEASGPVLEIMEGVDYWTAPEMLAALQSLQDAAERRENVMGDPSSFLDAKARLKAASDNALAVIAKATSGAAPAPAPDSAVTVTECLEVVKDLVKGVTAKDRAFDAMLKALRAAEYQLAEEVERRGDEDQQYAPPMAPTLKSIRAAIRKAEKAAA